MLNKELLMKFCSKDDYRKALNQPFLQEGFLFATDGRIAIKLNEFDKNMQFEIQSNPHCQSIFEDVKFNELIYQPLPELINKNPYKKCNECDGSGIIDTCECPNCTGHDCEECKGSGLLVDENSFMVIGDKKIHLRYLSLMKKLTNIAVCGNYRNANNLMPFLFNGGHGLVMPMKRDDESKNIA